MSHTQAEYRPDVDGLRALAVLLVVVFHAFPLQLPGGFVGVDVFFVISGFLISGIIFRELEKGTFGLTAFYWRRVRRIFPALVLVLLFVVFAGWLLFLPDEFASLGLHVAAGAGFVSNVALWRQGGYFDVASDVKPLLHLWSLGVEEQFYLGWPLLAMWLANRSHTFLVVAALAVVSFVGSVYLVHTDPSGAFYLPVSRLWQLLAGTLLAHYEMHRRPVRLSGRCQRALQSSAGLILLLLAALLLDAQTDYPGWWALVPTAGASLVLAAGRDAWPNEHILSWRGMIAIGLISYPLYLWHWPLLVIARLIDEGDTPSAAVRFGAIAAAFALAWLTFGLLERRVRHSTAWATTGHPTLGIVLLTSLMATAGIGLLAYTAFFRARASHDSFLSEVSRAASDARYGDDAVFPGSSARVVLFVGDSHMQHYLPRVRHLAASPLARRTMITDTQPGCAPIPGIERVGRECESFVARALRRAAEPDVDTIIVSASWHGLLLRDDYFMVEDGEGSALRLEDTADWERALAGLESALAGLRAAGKNVVIVLSSPRGEALHPKSLVDHTWLGVTPRQTSTLPANGVPRRRGGVDEELVLLADRIGAATIDPADWLCDDHACPSTDAAGRPLYRDTSHLRAAITSARFTGFDKYVLVEP